MQNTEGSNDGGNCQLLVVMPVFNEEEAVTRVIDEWIPQLRRCTPDFQLLAIDDGSTDESWNRLLEVRHSHGDCIQLFRWENKGHGACCVHGYHEATHRRIPWIFQIDSDGQCDPAFFPSLWEQRHHIDVAYGSRRWRDDGLFRMGSTWLLKTMLIFSERVYCTDPNSPYRLMRTETVAPKLRLAEKVDLANVALSVLLRRDPSVRHGAVPIRFRRRFGGVPSVKPLDFAGKAIELHSQLKALRQHDQPG